MREPLNSHRSHQANASAIPSCFGMLNGLATLIRLLPFPVGRKMQPLDPAPLLQPHYRPSSLVQAGPPQRPASVLSPHGFRHLSFSLSIRALVPVVPHKSLDRVHAPYTPAAARPVAKHPAHLSRKPHSLPVLTALSNIDASSKGLLSLVSPNLTCPRIRPRTLTPTLTTTAFDRSSLEWFEACSWKPASKGLPSSLTQLVHAQVRFSF